MHTILLRYDGVTASIPKCTPTHLRMHRLYRRQATAVRDLLRAISQERAYPLERSVRQTKCDF